MMRKGYDFEIKVIGEELWKRLQKEFEDHPDYDPVRTETAVVNGERISLSLIKKGCDIGGAVRLWNFIDWCRDDDYNTIDEMYAKMKKILIREADSERARDFSAKDAINATENIVPVVLNKALNAAAEKVMYHVDLPWSDELSVYFMLVVKMGNENVGITMITKERFEELKMSEDEFLAMAISNLHPKATPMADVMFDIFGERPDVPMIICEVDGIVRASGLLLMPSFFDQILQDNGWERAIVYPSSLYELLVIEDTEKMSSEHHYTTVYDTTMKMLPASDVFTLKPMRYETGKGFSVLDEPGGFYDNPTDISEVFHLLPNC